MNTTLITALEQTNKELEEVLSSIPREDFDRVPFAGSWTAGQVAEHLEKAIGPEILYGSTRPADRPADEKVGAIEAVFLNFDLKMKNPDFIEPTETVHDRDESIATLRKKFDGVIEAARTLDLSLICADFSVPVFGDFTRLEFMNLFLTHTQRHIRQLKKIKSALMSAGMTAQG